MIFSFTLLGCWLFLFLLAQRNVFHIALLGFPGVVLHELMHFVVGFLLFAKPTSFNLIPRRHHKGWEFGSVSFTGLTIFNAAPVTLAPFLLIGVAWYSFHLWMMPALFAHHYVEWILSGYLTACALFYSLPSSTDLKAGWLSTVLWGLIAGGCWWCWTVIKQG